MQTGELLTRSTIWLALSGYVAGAAFFLFNHQRAARWAWTLGCGCYFAHIVCAFQFQHAWSHAAAYQATAQQTAALTGWAWGGGLYINYAFTLLWTLDVASWWARGLASYAQRPAWLKAAWHGFFVFMLFNGAVVFAHSTARWLGVLLCVVLLTCWWLSRRRREQTRCSVL